MTKKFFPLLLAAALFSALACGSALAGEQTIPSVDLQLSWDKAPRGGQLVGEFYADSSDTRFVVEGSSYVKKDDTWIFGEQPVAEIELSAASGYRFSGTKFTAGNVHLKGCSAVFKSAAIDSDGSALVLQVSLPRIDGSLPATTSVSWSDQSATWDEVGGAKVYSVRLFRNNSLLATVTTSNLQYNFASWLGLEGSYTFSVQATGYSSSQTGPSVTTAEPYTLTADKAWFCDQGSWKKTTAGTRYLYANSVYPTNTWRYIDNAWYYFDKDGYMVSECYVKSPTSNGYRWMDADGTWDEEKDIEQPNRSLYSVY